MSEYSNMDPWGVIYRVGREKIVRKYLTSLNVNCEDYVTWKERVGRMREILPSYVNGRGRVFRDR